MILKHSKIGVSSEELSVRSLIHFIIELQNLFEYIGKYLLTVNETISLAESVTSGFLQFSFSQMKDSSKFFKGGITAYTPDEKIYLLHVDESEALACDCVSPNIAETMALNVSKIFKTDWSIAVTGYATPVQESNQKLYAYFSIVYKGQVILSEKLDLHSRTKQVNAQLYYTEFILGCFKLELDKHNENRSIS
ncbi:nicotinamide-nucleotide amidase [Chryseobacterium sp. SLBN-27]|uniref:CinA family protein n=1 Tax=Chryseobacterium sp. SLBN-27 TaxID=3042287 RepID=UPI00285D8A9F|nr:nicotinamide-nucleotide amidohydrolase family protein [Chryseobacterium sp. SLBN-27]MDR6157091.1 nicotinamide-nucleotide amidase [Chryseobacterium sp. SLBN-27]